MAWFARAMSLFALLVEQEVKEGYGVGGRVVEGGGVPVGGRVRGRGRLKGLLGGIECGRVQSPKGIQPLQGSTANRAQPCPQAWVMVIFAPNLTLGLDAAKIAAALSVAPDSRLTAWESVITSKDGSAAPRLAPVVEFAPAFRPVLILLSPLPLPMLLLLLPLLWLPVLSCCAACKARLRTSPWP